MDKNLYFFIDSKGKQHGPVKSEYFKDHGLAAKTLIWFNGLPDWIEAGSVTQLSHYIKESGVEQYLQPDHYHGYINNNLSGEAMHTTPPKSWFVESILLMLFCSFIPGVVALIYASKVTPKWLKREYAESIRYSNIAGNWIKWGFTITILLVTIYLVLSIFMPWADISVLKFNKYFNM